MQIATILKHKTRTFSFELFPPKTAEGEQKLTATIAALAALKPDFFSCTYGAGGSSRGKTLDIASQIQQAHAVPAMSHLTCVMHTKNEIRLILNEMKQRGISNVLALRGDPPKDNPNYVPGKDNFKYSSDLVRFIREEFGSYFNIGVAGFPEGHLLAKDKEADADVLKAKVDAGADFVITQLFFNNGDYLDYLKRLKQRGVNVPVVPGILPITDYHGLVRFCSLCGATIPKAVHDTFKPLADDPQATVAAGIEFAAAQCRNLLNSGAPGLHFYTLNKPSPTDKILSRI